jgi:hypothetical protein
MVLVKRKESSSSTLVWQVTFSGAPSFKYVPKGSQHSHSLLI